MQFNEARTRINLETPEDIELANEVTMATRYADEGKKRPKNPDRPQAQPPFELGDGASAGLINSLERAAIDVNDVLGLGITVRHEAYVTLLGLHKGLGKRKFRKYKEDLDERIANPKG